MSDLPSHPLVPCDARLASHATSASPAWLWSLDGTRILWANPVGAAIFGARSARELAGRRIEPGALSAKQVARLAGSLSHGGAPRLERLRGFGTSHMRALLCTCSRIVLPDQTRAVLIVAGEPAGPSLSLAQRVRRLFDEIAEDSTDTAIAVFLPDGMLLEATPEGRRRLGAATTLAALGAETIGTQAIADGRAGGTTEFGVLDIARLGSSRDLVLAARFAAQPAQAPSEAEPETEPADAPAATAPPEPQPVPPLPDAPAQEYASEDTLATAPDPEAPQPASPADDPAEADSADAEPARIDSAPAERRHPLRFVWQMDGDGRFNLGSDEFTEVIGPTVAVALGRPWREVAAALALDPEGQVERAVATRDTWSGITVSWPVDGTDERLMVELSGLPIYDRNRVFVGYRGFGVCRDIERINLLAQMRRGQTPGEDSLALARETAAMIAASRGPRPETERVALSLVPSAKNVVPFRGGAGAGPDGKNPLSNPGAIPTASPTLDPTLVPALSPVEHNAFRELARQLTARLKGDNGETEAADNAGVAPADGAEAQTAARDSVPARSAANERPLLDRLPIGVLVYRFDHLLYANRAFLDWTGYEDLHALAEAGGLDTLFIEGGLSPAGEIGGRGKSITIAAGSGDKLPVEGRLFSLPWNGEPSLVLMLLNAGIAERRKIAETPVPIDADTDASGLRSLLDATADGVIVIDRDARILSFNRAAPALFGRDAADLANAVLTDLLAPDSQRPLLQDLDNLARGATATIAQGREVVGRARDGGGIDLAMTIGRISGSDETFCASVRDNRAAKKAEREIAAARHQTEKAAADKSEFLAKISHEIRTPLNSIIGFSEVMIEERFGPIGNERYREYLNDIRASGSHAVSLINDLIDLTRIEAGELELTFVGVHLNEMVQSCVTLMQPQANREQIIVRTSLLPSLRPVVADARSVRQIILNLLSNSIKFTGSGGQVIVSTALSDAGRVVLRVRDTGIGMSDADLLAALDPLRHHATASRWGAPGGGLGLSLTRALADANHATFAISSKVNEGTLVEIAFPATRVLAD